MVELRAGEHQQYGRSGDLEIAGGSDPERRIDAEGNTGAALAICYPFPRAREGGRPPPPAMYRNRSTLVANRYEGKRP